jgi:hypothetical protein
VPALTERLPDVSYIVPTTRERLLGPGKRADQASDAPCTRDCQRLATLRSRMDDIVAGDFEDLTLRVDGKAGDLMTMDFAA